MTCLRCGYCCQNMFIVIVDNPELGMIEENLRTLMGERCPHLQGDKMGEYSCRVHNYSWYDDTPCAEFGQIEKNEDDLCRLGNYRLNREVEDNHKEVMR